MLKRDFIMIQIEELAKIVLQIIMNRNTNAARHTPELIQTVYSSLKLDRPTLMTVPPEELIRRLDSDDNGGLLRLEIAVKTLIEESYFYPDKEQAMLQKAKVLLEYIQTHDKTFSLERVNMLDELERRIQ
ncbi:hypothetical protein [uncultured Parabacteroides sp.]|uniref:hypothetical protein n=1 Tax=Parabacteroides sp. ASD2025 TaxID=3415987 RepID=UPI002637D829|nr:hypothetical protein [uncultured Parabacteroides sp.]